jgi:predicted nuclease of predicted toxin-antitoxin system
MNIKFLLDENMPFALIEFLRNKGYETEHIKQLGQGGIRNGEVYQVALEKDAWILTRDSDFKSYHKFVIHPIKGIIVITLSDTRTQNILNYVQQFLETQFEKLLSKHLIIIEEGEIKIYGDSEVK